MMKKKLIDSLPWLVAVLVVALVAIMVLWVTPMKVIASGSMAPTLPIGSRIFLQDASDIQEGDIITFRDNDNEVVTHRIVELRPDGSIITKGDANLTPDVYDPPITSEDVLGKVTYMSPVLTADFQKWFWTSPRGVAAILLLVIIVITLLWKSDENESEPEGAETHTPA